jgi:hypothetical protein
MFVGSNPAKGDEFLNVIIRSTPSFGGEVKPLAPCLKISWHLKDPFESTKQMLRKAQIVISFASFSCFVTR